MFTRQSMTLDVITWLFVAPLSAIVTRATYIYVVLSTVTGSFAVVPRDGPPTVRNIKYTPNKSANSCHLTVAPNDHCMDMTRYSHFDVNEASDWSVPNNTLRRLLNRVIEIFV